MSYLAPCPGCCAGQHERHVANWVQVPDGVLGGALCSCPGDCQPGPFPSPFDTSADAETP